MAIRGNSIVICYVAWDTVNNLGKTGDVANHTIKVVKDGAEATAANAPAEVDAANMKGVYKLVLSATEMTCDCITVGGISSTAGIVIIPVVITTEHGVLPNIVQGNAGAVVTSGAGTGQISLAAGAVTTTAASNAAIATAILTDTTAGDFTVAGSPGKVLVTQLGGAFTTGTSVYTAAALVNAAGGAPSAGTVAAAVWQDLLASADFSTANSIGALLKKLTFTGTSVNSVVSAYAAGQDPATLVLDVGAGLHNTAGTIGAKINAGGSAGDPWTGVLPGGYAAGTAGYIVGTNLDAKVSTRSTFAGGAVASVTAPVTVGTNTDKTAYSLAANGLDQISVVDPGPAASQNTLPKMLVALWRRWFKKTTMDPNTTKTYGDDNATVNTTQALTYDGTTQTQGPST